MKKNFIQKEFQKNIMDHGIAHLVYFQNGIQDLLHPFSIEGYELLSALALMLCGSFVAAGVHEFIVMLLCFFGDYVMEFILVTHYGIREDTKKLEQLRNMKVVFKFDMQKP